MTNADDLDALLDDMTLDFSSEIEQELTSLAEDTSDSIPISIIELAEGETDPRLKLLSHSSRTDLHKCPRKYQLYRLNAQEVSLGPEAEIQQGVTFAYGTAVGVGMASTLEGKTDDQIYLDTFLSWDADLLAEDTKRKKSYWLAHFAVQKFIALRAAGFLDEYELVYYKGKPAVELSFQILLPKGFRYRGFVDAVLKHRDTGEVMVLEAKTSSSDANPAYFKNSGQALGYSVVLDILFPSLSSYLVLYLVYETKNYEYVELPFKKSLLQRALWLQELLIDTQVAEIYESYHTYPMHGWNCYDFFHNCKYLSLCTLATKNLVKPLTQEIVDKIEKEKESYDFTVDFFDLVEAQVAKGEE